MSKQRPIRYRQSKRMRTQITLQQWTETGTDAHGQPEGAWADLPNTPRIWAHVQPVTGRVAEYTRQLYELTTHRVTIDYRSDMTRHMRVKLGSRYLYIGHILDLDELNITMELLCVEGDAYGS
jgi:SPP1 family predicted phage head-tail adaptor